MEPTSAPKAPNPAAMRTARQSQTPAATAATTATTLSWPPPNAVVSVEPAAEKLNPAIEHPFPFYLWEIRRDGGTWWNANQIISRLGQAIGSCLPAPPEPEPVPGPAFRGGAPEPEPVLDASGGVGGGGDYQPTDFGGAPVLQAPIIAVLVLPAGAARCLP